MEHSAGMTAMSKKASNENAQCSNACIYNLVAAEREQLVKEGERNRDLRYIIDMKRLLKLVKRS